MRERIGRVLRSIRGARAVTSSAAREALLSGANPGAPFDAWAEKVRREAYRIGDDDVAALRAAGASEDEIYEVTVCAAVSASLLHLDLGLSALGRKR